MSTRSRIALRHLDGTFTSIYCHFDGYPEGVGRTLLNHWSSEAAVKALMDLGNLSILGEVIGEKHSFDTHTSDDRNDCRAYGRDRGERDTHALRSMTKASLVELAEDYCADYLYVFSGNEWHWQSLCGTSGRLRKLHSKSVG